MYFNQNRTSTETIKIGLINTLTGSLAATGEEAQRGYEIAIDELRKEYGIDESLVEFFSEDSQTQVPVGISAYEKMKSIDGIDSVVTVSTPISVAIANLKKNNEDGVIQFGVASWGSSYRTGGRYNFRIDMVVEKASEKLVDYITSKGYQRVAILQINNDFGLDFTNAFTKDLKTRFNKEVVGIETFLPTENDYKTVVAKVKQMNPDVVFIIPYSGKVAGTIIKDARNIGFAGDFVSLSTAQDKDLISVAGGFADGLTYVFPLSQDKNKQLDDLIDAYKKKYNSEPNNIYPVAVAYQSLKTIVLKHQQCDFKKDNECVVQKLLDDTNIDTIFGSLKFDSNHDASFVPTLKTVKNGEFVNLQ